MRDGKTYFRAVMPPEAWKNDREPRERRQRKRAVEDLIEGLDRYLTHRVFGSNKAVAGRDAIAWTVWAAHLAKPGVNYIGPAPDMSEWRINARWEL